MSTVSYSEGLHHNSSIFDPGPHVARLENSQISKLAPFSALILCIVFVILFLIRFYVLEGFLLKKFYGNIYTRLDDVARRGFVNHHIAGIMKIVILILAAYPFIDVAFVKGTFQTPFAGSKIVTLGDVLVVATQMLIAVYVFELFYRPKISPVSVAHHIGTIMIGQSAIAISLNYLREKDATIEFVLCTVWGAFDIVCESLPHLSIILYRVYPDSHDFLRNLFRAAAITTFAGTIAETMVTMYLFGSLWNRWTLAFKITTPMLHLLFMSAQLWGTYNFIKMYQRQCRFIDKREGEQEDLETGRNEAQDVSKNGLKVEATRADISRDGSETALIEQPWVAHSVEGRRGDAPTEGSNVEMTEHSNTQLRP